MAWEFTVDGTPDTRVFEDYAAVEKAIKADAKRRLIPDGANIAIRRTSRQGAVLPPSLTPPATNTPTFGSQLNQTLFWITVVLLVWAARFTWRAIEHGNHVREQAHVTTPVR